VILSIDLAGSPSALSPPRWPDKPFAELLALAFNNRDEQRRAPQHTSSAYVRTSGKEKLTDGVFRPHARRESTNKQARLAWSGMIIRFPRGRLPGRRKTFSRSPVLLQ
jgi:hypothetical protein